MISLTDYIGYLNSQIMDARRLADEAAVAMAKTYAEDPHLRFFKVPRFTMGNVKLDVPIKIDAVNQETKYDFQFKEDDFMGRMNKSINLLSREWKIKLIPFNREMVANRNFRTYLEELNTREGGFVRDIDFVLQREETDKYFSKLFLQLILGRRVDNDINRLVEELHEVFHKSLRAQYQPLVTNINNLAVSPQANGLKAQDSDKLLINLHLELVEEGIQIRQVTDENGDVIEQVIVD